MEKNYFSQCLQMDTVLALHLAKLLWASGLAKMKAKDPVRALMSMQLPWACVWLYIQLLLNVLISHRSLIPSFPSGLRWSIIFFHP